MMTLFEVGWVVHEVGVGDVVLRDLFSLMWSTPGELEELGLVVLRDLFFLVWSTPGGKLEELGLEVKWQG